jgi:hypothetical protein
MDGRGEFQFGELRVPSGSSPHPVAIVMYAIRVPGGAARMLVSMLITPF